MLKRADTVVLQQLVKLEGLTKSYAKAVAVHPLDLSIQRGEFLAILGPSGCGKTTLLKMISGFVHPTGGAIWINGQDVTTVSPERRSTNMVFQGYGLFPHMSVAQNIAYGLHIRKTPRAEIEQRVREAMDLVQLGEFADRSVGQLSGGQAQRVALARALILRPEVLLLDEPLAALDLKLRKAMQEELRRIHLATGGTFVFVTHDQEEAMALATRICVMDHGRVVQDDVPEEIYAHPKSRFVSTFIGDANLMEGQRKRNIICLENELEIPHKGPDGNVVCMIRPERMEIAPLDGGKLPSGVTAQLTARLDHSVFLGSYVKYVVRLNDGRRLRIDSRDLSIRQVLTDGAQVRIGWRLEDQIVLADGS